MGAQRAAIPLTIHAVTRLAGRKVAGKDNTLAQFEGAGLFHGEKHLVLDQQGFLHFAHHTRQTGEIMGFQ